MSSINKVILVGNVGKEPEVRQTQTGQEIASFSLATSDSWRDKNTGERREKSEWHNIVVFNEGLVKVIKNYVHKGSKLYVEGALQTRKWVDSGGADRYTTEIVLQAYNGQIVLLGGKSEGGHSEAKQNGYQAQPAAQPDLDDEIPFAFALPLIGGGLLTCLSYMTGAIQSVV
jgi:single-strand DNA-binding protein